MHPDERAKKPILARSTWRQVESGLLFAVVYANPGEVLALHTETTWRGTCEEFFAQFEEVRG